MSENKIVLVPPNGAYGWIVVLAAQLVNIFDRSMISVFSIIFGPFFNAIELSKKNVALVMNVTNLFLNFTGLFVGALIKAFSPRSVAICASLSISLGLIITSFTSTIYEIIFSYCFLVGTGLGCITNATMVVVTSYFTTKKGRAVSFSMAGSGIGKVLMPQIVTLLVIFYDYREVILLMGALALHGVVGSLLFHPVEWHMKKKIDDDESIPLLVDHRRNFKHAAVAHREEVHENFWQKISKQLDLSLLKDSRFIILNLALACDYAVAVDFTLIFPFYLEDIVNLSKREIAMCLSVFAFCDLSSRMSFSIIAEKLKISPKSAYVCGLLIVGVLREVIGHLRSFKSVLIVIGLFGYIRAITTVNQVILVSELCSKYYPEKFSAAYGINMIFKGIAAITIGQFLGHVRDATNDYDMSYYAQNSFLAFIIILWSVEAICRRGN